MADVACGMHTDVDLDTGHVAGTLHLGVDITGVPNDLLELVQLLSTGASRPDVLANDLRHLSCFFEGDDDVVGRLALLFFQDVGKALDVSAEVIAHSSPIDLHDIASSNNLVHRSRPRTARAAKPDRRIPSSLEPPFLPPLLQPQGNVL